MRRPPRLTIINKFEKLWLDLLWEGELNEFTTEQAREYLQEQRNHYGRRYTRVPVRARLHSMLRKSPYFHREMTGPWLRTEQQEEE